MKINIVRICLSLTLVINISACVTSPTPSTTWAACAPPLSGCVGYFSIDKLPAVIGAGPAGNQEPEAEKSDKPE